MLAVFQPCICSCCVVNGWYDSNNAVQSLRPFPNSMASQPPGWRCIKLVKSYDTPWITQVLSMVVTVGDFGESVMSCLDDFSRIGGCVIGTTIGKSVVNNRKVLCVVQTTRCKWYFGNSSFHSDKTMTPRDSSTASSTMAPMGGGRGEQYKDEYHRQNAK